jgi:uncharacterized protein DUF1440
VPRISRPLAIDVLIGAAAGAAATWAMDAVTSLIQERQPEEITERETEVRGKKTAYEIAAEKGAKLVGRRLLKKERQAIGTGIHWSLGVGSGALYGVLRNRVRYVGIGSGVAFGIAMFALLDEAALAAFGLVPPPRDFPWQTHARGFAGHLVLGAILDGAFDLADLAS